MERARRRNAARGRSGGFADRARLRAVLPVLYTRTGKTERVARLCEVHANKHEERELLEAGDIAGIVGLKDTLTGQTLTGNSAAGRAHALVLGQITIPQPVIDVAIEPNTQADQQGLGKALHALVRTPDPARAAGRRVGPYDPVRHGRAAARGDGREAARAAPRERGCRSAAGGVLRDHRARGRGHASAQEADRRAGQFAQVTLRIGRLARGEGVRFANVSVGGAIPRE